MQKAAKSVALLAIALFVGLLAITLLHPSASKAGSTSQVMAQAAYTGAGPDATGEAEAFVHAGASSPTEIEGPSCVDVNAPGESAIGTMSIDLVGYTDDVAMIERFAAPVTCILTCPANVTVSNDAFQCGAVVTFPAPMTLGTCGTVVASPASGSFFPKGPTTVTVTASAGPTCTFTVTINDTQPPTITCSPNLFVAAAQGASAAVVSFTTVASDNCPGIGIACNHPTGSTFVIGVTLVTCTATDSTGNTATCSFTVTVTAPSTVGVFHNAAWFLNNQNDGSSPEFSFFYGASNYIPVSGDWDCNGTVTPGIFLNGVWYLSNRKDGLGPVIGFFYGSTGDTPVVGDWNGDGCDTVGVFHNAAWFLNNQNDGSPPEYSFFYGSPGDIPVTGDWDGNGTTTVGVFHNAAWFLNNQNDGSPPEYSFFYGSIGDVPVTGDWDGNRTTTVGVFHNAAWFLNNQNDGSFPEYLFFYGGVTDKPVTGAWGISASSVTVEPDAAPVTGCAATFSCQPGPNDWTGARAAADEALLSAKGAIGQGWSPSVLPPPGWSEPATLPAPGWSESDAPAPGPVPSAPAPSPVATPVPAPGATKGGLPASGGSQLPTKQ